LEKALSRYQAVIEIQQQQLTDAQSKRAEQDEVLRALRQEIDALRSSLAPPSAK